MSMVRALRTLNAIENGDLTGSQYESILTGSAARVGELRVLLGITSQYKRMAASPTTCAAIGNSATAMNQLLSITAPAEYMLADTTATSNLVSGSQGAAKTLAYLAGLDYANYATMDAALLSLDLNAAITNTPAATTVFNLSTVAVGKKIAKDSGLATASYDNVQALAANAGAMATVVGSSAGRTTMLTSSLGMNYMLDSATAVSAIDGNSTTLAALRALEMASVKYIAKKTGTIDQYDYTTAAQMVASADFATATATTAAAGTAAGLTTNATVTSAMLGSTSYMTIAATGFELMAGLGSQSGLATTIKTSATIMPILVSNTNTGPGVRGFTSTTTGASAFYSSDYFVPSANRERALVYGLYPTTSYTATDYTGNGRIMAGGTGTIVSVGPNNLNVMRGASGTITNFGFLSGGIVSTTGHAITVVLTCHVSTPIPLMGSNTPNAGYYGYYIYPANNAVGFRYSSSYDEMTTVAAGSIPSNGTTYIVLQLRVLTNGNTLYVRINNGTEYAGTITGSVPLSVLTFIGGAGYTVAGSVGAIYSSNNISFGDFIITKDPTNATQLATIRNALGKKYGLF